MIVDVTLRLVISTLASTDSVGTNRWIVMLQPQRLVQRMDELLGDVIAA